MKTLLTLLAAFLIAGCASSEEKEYSTQDINQAVRDFIELRSLKSLNSLKSGPQDSWQQITDTFILYEGRRDTYLVEFMRRCYELNDNTRITPDHRWDTNAVRARFDTIRGCRIATIYGLTEPEVAELENIGEPPGSRN